MMKIIIFGAGLAHYPIVRFLNYEKVELIAFADNNLAKVGNKIDGVMIVEPNEIVNKDFDYILISSENSYIEISEQLISMGINKGKIVQPYNYMANFPERFFFNDEELEDERMKYLFTNNYVFRISGFNT